MIDEKKVSLMTKIAIYEKKEGNRNLQMSKFYRSDYIRYNVLKTLVAATVVYWAIVGAYVFLKFEELLAKINEIDYFNLMYKLLGGYVVFCVIYFFIGEFVYSYKFYKAKKGLVRYNVNLKKLIELEGGKKKRKKKKPAVVGTVVEDDEGLVIDEPTNNKTSVRVRRSDMVNQRMAEEAEVKRQQVYENSKKIKEKYAAKEEARLQMQRQIEEEKLRKQEQQRMRYEKSRMEQQKILEEQQRKLQELQRQQIFIDNDGNNGRSGN